ncbi:hypothetical protein [Fischerella sp. PCC 9605]|nr:hypothetical protein [Fischerella sp. PCC 9605]
MAAPAAPDAGGGMTVTAAADLCGTKPSLEKAGIAERNFAITLY